MSVSNHAPGVVSSPETTVIGAAVSRTNLLLLLALLLQLAVCVYLFWPSQGVVGRGEPLLADVTTDSVTTLTITDNNDRSVSFVKVGEMWTLANTDGYPARAEKISQTLDKLTAIATDRLVTRTAASHDRLQVAADNFLRKVDITTASGVQTLYLGSSTGASATHVRSATEDATYLTGALATWELDTLPTTWIEVVYFRVPKDQISEVTLDNANGSFTFVPTQGGTGQEWTLADAADDEPIASANINTLIDRIATLNLHSVLGKNDVAAYALDTPLATITVTSMDVTTATTTAATKTTTLVVGAKDTETNTYYLKSSDSEFYVRLAAFTGDEFVNKQRSDFLIQPSEAETNDPAASSPTAEVTQPEVSATAVATDTIETEADVPADADADMDAAATPTN